MIAYNSTINTNTIKEKSILSEINRKEKELLEYGLSKEEINNITKGRYDIDLCSYDIEKVLLNISICEFLWYNKLCEEYKKLKGSLKKTFMYDNNNKLNSFEENGHYNTFLSAMTLIVQKYGKEILEE